MIDVKYNEVKDRNSWIDGNYLLKLPTPIRCD